MAVCFDFCGTESATTLTRGATGAGGRGTDGGVYRFQARNEPVCAFAVPPPINILFDPLPLPVGGTVVVGDFEGYLHFLARDSGAFVARAETDGSAVRAAPLGIDGGFVVQTQDGGLFALAP